MVDPLAGATTLPIGSSGAAVTLPAGFAAAVPSGIQLRLAHFADAYLLLTLITSSTASVPATTAAIGRSLLATAPTMDGALSVIVVSGERWGCWMGGVVGGRTMVCVGSLVEHYLLKFAAHSHLPVANPHRQVWSM